MSNILEGKYYILCSELPNVKLLVNGDFEVATNELFAIYSAFPDATTELFLERTGTVKVSDSDQIKRFEKMMDSKDRGDV